MKFQFLSKEALYKENGELFVVKIVSQKEDSWGLTLSLKIAVNRFGRENDYDEMEYFSKEIFKDEFTVSGAWDVVSFSNEILRIAYVGVEINFRQAAISAFINEGNDWYDIWNARE